MLSKPIVVLGGGFAGVMAAKTLRKLLPADQYKSYFSVKKIIWFFIRSWLK